MKKYILILITAANFIACKKLDIWLDVKSNKADVIPSSLADLQAILDNDGVMNKNYPAIGDVSSDNYYITYPKWQSVSFQGRNAYIWAKDIFEGFSNGDWNYGYQMVEYANIVLDILSKINPSPSDSAQWNNVKGSALFFRAQAFHNLVQLFSRPYDSNTADSDLGIPIRTTSDVNKVSVRSSLQKTYDRIISDLKEAAALLPERSLYKTRPSKITATALLARVYLTMSDYTAAMQYAGEVLLNYDDLIDYNTIDTLPLFTIPNYQKGNIEVIFFAQSLSYGIGAFPAIIDTVLYKSYDSNDLRRSVYYTLRPDGLTFRGNYTGNGITYSGISTNEIYLIRSECYARLNKIPEAMNDLNNLLLNRWKRGTFVSFNANSVDDALDIILNERRKELPFNANLRWQDLRRLNKEHNRAITLKRELNGHTYTLPPNDNRYVFPIPPDEIKLSGIEQNER